MVDVVENLEILEEINVSSLLGIRFWDPVMDAQIGEDLLVRAWPVAGGRPVVHAYRTVSGIYVFAWLPGMRAQELQWPRPSGGDSPPQTREFVVEIRDLRRPERFLPVAKHITVPLRTDGPYLLDSPLLSPSRSAGGFLLYSAPTRGIPSWMAAVRGRLVDTHDEAAAWAVVRVRVPGGHTWHGVADEAGRSLVLFPYPTIENGLGGSPPRRKPLADEHWPITVEVYYAPGEQVPLPGTSFPDYLSVLGQAQADIVDGGTVMPKWSGELPFGRIVRLSSMGQEDLVVRPRGSPP